MGQYHRNLGLSNQNVFRAHHLFPQQPIFVPALNSASGTIQPLALSQNQAAMPQNQQPSFGPTSGPQTGQAIQDGQVVGTSSAVTYLTPALQLSAAKENEILRKMDDRANKLIHLLERMQTNKTPENGRDSAGESNDVVYYRKHYNDAAESANSVRGPPVADARQVIAKKKLAKQNNRKGSHPPATSDFFGANTQPQKSRSNSNVDDTGRKKRVLKQTHAEVTPPPPPMASLRDQERQVDAALVSTELLRKSWGRGMELNRLLVQLPTELEEQQLREHLERRIAAVYRSDANDDSTQSSSSSCTDVLDMRQYEGSKAKTFVASVHGKTGVVLAPLDTYGKDSKHAKPSNVFIADPELEVLYDSSHPKPKKPKILRLGSSMPPSSIAKFPVLSHICTPDGILSSSFVSGLKWPQKMPTRVQQKSELASREKTALDNKRQPSAILGSYSTSKNSNSKINNSDAKTKSFSVDTESSVTPQPDQPEIFPVSSQPQVKHTSKQLSFAALSTPVAVDDMDGNSPLQKSVDDAVEYSPTMHSPASYATVEDDGRKSLAESALPSPKSDIVNDDQQSILSSTEYDDEVHPHNIIYPPTFDYTSWREIAHNVDIKLIGMSLDASGSAKNIAKIEQSLVSSKTEMHDARQSLQAHRMLYDSIDKVIEGRRNDCFVEECKLQAMEGRVRKMEQDLTAEKVRVEAQRKSLVLPRGLLSFAERERELAEKRETILLQRMQASQQRYTEVANELRDVRNAEEDNEAATSLNADIMLSSSSTAAEVNSATKTSFGSNTLSSLMTIGTKPRSRAMFFDSIEQVNLQRKALLAGRMLRPGDEESAALNASEVRQFIPDSDGFNELLFSNNSKMGDAGKPVVAFSVASGEESIRQLDEELQQRELSRALMLQSGEEEGDTVNDIFSNNYWQNFKWYRLEWCLNQLAAKPVDGDDMLLMMLYGDVNQTAESVWSIDSSGAVLFDPKWWDKTRSKALSTKLQLATSRVAVSAVEGPAQSSSPVSVALMIHLEQLLIFDLLLYSLVYTLCGSMDSTAAGDGGNWPFFTNDYSRDAVTIDKLFGACKANKFYSKNDT